MVHAIAAPDSLCAQDCGDAGAALRPRGVAYCPIIMNYRDRTRRNSNPLTEKIRKSPAKARDHGSHQIIDPDALRIARRPNKAGF